MSHGTQVTTAKPETRTNAATLIGCYLVLEKGLTAEEAWAPFEFENACPFLTFRDASFDTETYHLLPIDVLRGMCGGLPVNTLSLCVAVCVAVFAVAHRCSARYLCDITHMNE